METKVCIKCDSEKDVTEFQGRWKVCKTCREKKERENKIYREKNKEVLRLKKRVWYKNNKESDQEKKKDYYQKNKEEIKRKSKKWRENNKERSKEYHTEYRKNNIERIRKRDSEYLRNKREVNPLFKLSSNIRTYMRSSITKGGYTKKSKTFEILGCSYEEFREHIESHWEDWMNWDNYGLYNGEENYGWDLDHIVPLSSALCEEDIIRLNHHSNIQPLCSYVNRNVKRDIVDWVS